MTITPEFAWLTACGGCVLEWLVLISSGWPQRKEAGSPVAWFVWVTACLALMAASPLVVSAALVSLGIGGDGLALAAPFLSLVALISVAPAVLPPVRLRGTKTKLPRVEDPQFLTRMSTLAGKMNIRVPFARLWPSLTGSQPMMAFAGTLPAPQIVVTDGILRRLAAVECDAIVGHELAHIANGSLWYLFGVNPICCAVAAGLAAFFPGWFVGGFTFSLMVGVRRLVSRHFELDCDRRAAEAIGFAETAMALAKIHAIHPVRNTGLLSLLVYATATHPSRDVRLWALHVRAPESIKDAISINQPAVRRQRLATFAALAIWFLGMAGSLIGIISDPEARWPTWIPYALAITPMSLLILGVRKKTSLTRRRQATTTRWGLWLSCTYLGFMIFAWSTQSWAPSIGPVSGNPPGYGLDVDNITGIVMTLSSLVFLACLVVWLGWMQKVHKLRAKVLVAMQVHDFAGAIELGQANARTVARDLRLRYNLALARAVRGEKSTAIAMLERLCHDKPSFGMAGILLHVLLLEAGEAQRALDVVRTASSLKDDPDADLMAARALRRLGRMDDAQAACDRALAREPESATAHATSAALALDRGDLDGAQRLIDRALELAPGECYLLVVRAEIAVRTRPLAEARTIVAETAGTVRANPLVFLRPELEALERAVAEPEVAVV